MLLEMLYPARMPSSFPLDSPARAGIHRSNGGRCWRATQMGRPFFIVDRPVNDGVDRPDDLEGLLPLQHNVPIAPIDRTKSTIIKAELCPDLIKAWVDRDRFVQEVLVDALHTTSRPDPTVTNAGAPRGGDLASSHHPHDFLAGRLDPL